MQKFGIYFKIVEEDIKEKQDLINQVFENRIDRKELELLFQKQIELFIQSGEKMTLITSVLNILIFYKIFGFYPKKIYNERDYYNSKKVQNQQIENSKEKFTLNYQNLVSFKFDDNFFTFSRICFQYYVKIISKYLKNGPKQSEILELFQLKKGFCQKYFDVTDKRQSYIRKSFCFDKHIEAIENFKKFHGKGVKDLSPEQFQQKLQYQQKLCFYRKRFYENEQIFQKIPQQFEILNTLYRNINAEVDYQDLLQPKLNQNPQIQPPQIQSPQIQQPQIQQPQIQQPNIFADFDQQIAQESQQFDQLQSDFQTQLQDEQPFIEIDFFSNHQQDLEDDRIRQMVEKLFEESEQHSFH